VKNWLELKQVAELSGPWDVQFDPKWFYPDNGTGGKITFNGLSDWTAHADPAIKHYSGIATYRKSFDLPQVSSFEFPVSNLFLSLGQVLELARVKLNGRDLGVVWCPPWTVEIPAGVLKEKGNQLEIEVVNFWPNRLIGDAKLAVEQRRTKTNITAFYEPKALGSNPRHNPGALCERLHGTMPKDCSEIVHYSTLHPSGLIGPVRLMTAE
jgi:hypothetical protein